MSTRRRRVVGALAAVAQRRLRDRAVRSAAAALAMVAALTAACSGGGPAPNASPPSSESPSSPPSGASWTPPPGPKAWVDDLPLGKPPRIGYVIDHTFHRSDGSTIRLRHRWGIQSIVAVGDGYLATDDFAFEGTHYLVRFDGKGRRIGGPVSVVNQPVLDPDGSRVYWMTFTPPESGDFQPTRIRWADVATGVEGFHDLAAQGLVRPSVLGVFDGDVVYAALRPQRHVVIALSDPPRRIRGIGYPAAVSTRAGLLGTVARDGGMSGQVVTYPDGAVLWRRRGTRPVAFSPSGRLLLVAGREGRQIVDARTGELHTSIPNPRGRRWWPSYAGTWEDEHHVLVPISGERRAAVVRFDVRSGEWELSVPGTRLPESHEVTFETTR